MNWDDEIARKLSWMIGMKKKIEINNVFHSTLA
jgi:hypothetical protein